MNKNIIIYENNSLKNKKIYENFIKYNEKLYLLYDAKYINPPFFDKIVFTLDNLKKEDEENSLKMIYNMTKVNGTIIYLKKYNYFFKNSYEEYNGKYSIYHKKNNILYVFPKYRVVEFIIMGAQKCGTTSLSLNIGKHPDIYINCNHDPKISEIHFFDIYWKRGIEWYKKHFDYSKKIVGEKTPDLMYLEYTFPYIQSVNPYIKIIIILRDPIERAYSSWKLMKKYFNEKRTFEESIKDELKYKLDENITFYTSNTHYLQKGLYYMQIIKILKWFSKDNLLILISENVKKNMKEEYNKVYSFLNLKEFDADYKLEFESDNKSIIDRNIYKKLIKFYKKDVKNLEELLGIKTNWLNLY
jgi:hypothetical protein